MKIGARVRRNGQVKVGVVVSLYKGMQTATPYAMVDWGSDGEEHLHVDQQADLEVVE